MFFFVCGESRRQFRLFSFLISSRFPFRSVLGSARRHRAVRRRSSRRSLTFVWRKRTVNIQHTHTSRALLSCTRVALLECPTHVFVISYIYNRTHNQTKQTNKQTISQATAKSSPQFFEEKDARFPLRCPYGFHRYSQPSAVFTWGSNI
jgi:hypothetical protein